jgi:hypothetical protein
MDCFVPTAHSGPSAFALDSKIAICDRPIFYVKRKYRGLIIFRIKNAMPKEIQRVPTTTYAAPRKEFFPPKSEVFERTTDLVPPNLETANRCEMVSCQVPFGNKLPLFAPHNFLNVGNPAVLIHTWNLSSSPKFGKFSTV